jgi:AmiR/NasT family two-component response regulator
VAVVDTGTTAETQTNHAWAAQLLAGARTADGDEVGVVSSLLDMVQTVREENRQLQEALDSRVAIEQAKGVLAERFAIDVEEAFVLLRRSARSGRVKLRSLAERVAGSRETPVEIVEALTALERRGVR